MSIPAPVATFYERIWNAGDLRVVAALLTPDFAFRSSLGTEMRGQDAFADYVRQVRSALSGYRCEISECVAEGEQAFARMLFSGRHVGVFRGYEPTGKLVSWQGAALFRFRGERIASLWVLGDVAGLDGILRENAMSDIRVVVAPADFADWSGLLGLLRSAYAYMESRIDPPSSVLRLDLEQIERKAAEETLILALADGRLAGCAFASGRANCLYLSKLAVSASVRRRGVARRLVEQAERLARAASLPFLELETRIELTENHETFAALGFRKTAETSHPGRGRTTSITMRKAVAPVP